MYDRVLSEEQLLNTQLSRGYSIRLKEGPHKSGRNIKVIASHDKSICLMLLDYIPIYSSTFSHRNATFSSARPTSEGIMWRSCAATRRRSLFRAVAICWSHTRTYMGMSIHTCIYTVRIYIYMRVE